MKQYFESPSVKWVEDFWLTQLSEYTKQFKSVLPYTLCVSKDKQTVKLEMAFAGYAPSDVEVTYSNSGLLAIKAGKTNADESLDYVHKGIAQRFINFLLPVCSSYTVKDAVMTNGILKITFERLPASPPTQIKVKSL